MIGYVYSFDVDEVGVLYEEMMMILLILVFLDEGVYLGVYFDVEVDVDVNLIV